MNAAGILGLFATLECLMSPPREMYSHISSRTARRGDFALHGKNKEKNKDPRKTDKALNLNLE